MHTRREAIAVAGLTIVGTAGCLDEDGDADETETDSNGDADEPQTDSDGDSGTNASADATGGGELRESEVSARNPDATFLTVSKTDGDDDADERVLATYGDVVAVGTVTTDRQAGYALPIQFGDSAVESIVAELEAIGALDDPGTVELATRVDGEALDSYRLGPDLAAVMADGEWDGTLTVGSSDESALETVRDEFQPA